MSAHKYVKRTGSQGAYKYWYKLPDGRVAEGNDAQQKQGRVEHVKRLIAGKRAGRHTLSHDRIAAITGHDADNVRSVASNMATRGEIREDHQMDESQHSDVTSPDYQRHVEQHAGSSGSSDSATAAPARSSTPRPRRSRGVERGRGLEPEGAPTGDAAAASTPAHPAASARPTDAPAGGDRPAAGAASSPAAPATPAVDPREARKKELLGKLKRDHGVDLTTPAAAATPPDSAEGPTGSPEEAATARRMSKRLQAAATAPPEAMPSATPAAPAARPATSSTTPGGQELMRFDPDFAASETATQKMIEQQEQGANPYIVKAADIFGRIMGDVQEPRKTKVRNMLNALVKAQRESQEHGTAMSKDLVLAHYKAAPGNERARSLPESDFEAATFHTADEVIGNQPIDPEIERMKRGFAAKQYARMKPFLSATFAAAHPDGPPPYPTYGDLKGWGDHLGDTGETRPDWAGGTSNMRAGQKKAMPKEFFDSIPKGADGKPAMPPMWMPLHLAPVWSYIVKSKGTGLAYAGSNITADQAEQGHGIKQGRGQKIAMTSQSPTDDQVAAGTHAAEGILVKSLRKYVQMRGGPGQLTDIPRTKLPEGTNMQDLFRSDAATAGDDGMDKELQRALTTKIIDPVELMPFVMKELGVKLPKEKAAASAEKPVKKSFSLIVDLNGDYNAGESLLRSSPEVVIDLWKAEKVRRIREELRARGL